MNCINNERKKYNKEIVLVSLVTAALFLTICSKSSFLYPINDWLDANCFFTVGKAIMNGQVLYKDIYEQKGPLLYFIHGIAYLFSKRSFLGVYFIEVASFSGFLYIAAKCAELYLQNKKIVYFIIPILAAIITMSRAFAHGDSVEELSLVLIMYSIYSVLKSIFENRHLRPKEIIINGVCAAIILWMKFTILGFYIGLVLFVIFWYAIDNQIKELLKVIVFFILGAGLTTLPVMVYALATHSVIDMLQVYFYNNMFLYPYELPGNRIVVILNCIVDVIQNNVCFSIFMVVGLVWMFSKSRKEWLAVWMSFGGLVMGAYWGGRSYIYYGLIFSMYALFGIIAMFSVMTEAGKIKFREKKEVISLLMIMYFILLCLNYYLSDNVYLMHYRKDDLPQYKFAKIINSVPDASLLNYGFLDGGFYLAADVVPENKFFCRLNTILQELDDEQNKYVEDGKVDFVVTRDIKLEDWGIDTSKYTCIQQEQFYFEGADHIYYLYELM